MRVRHWNCGTMCPFGRRGLEGAGSYLEAARLVCRVLLVETPSSGLVLVDSGLGLADCALGGQRLGRRFSTFVRPRLDVAETAVRRVEAAGFARDDVRHVVLTHLDLDHAGGLADFPEARVHLLRAEREAAEARRSFTERERYRPVQWAHAPRFQTYDAAGEPWHGFEAVRALEGLPPEILVIPLTGHTRGHAGVAVRDGDGWLLHAGDAFFFRGEIAEPPHCPPFLRAFQRVLAIDEDARRTNQARLRTLAADATAGVRIVCAHDPAMHPSI